MLLDLDRFPSSQLAAIDSHGNQLTLGEIFALADLLRTTLPPRSLIFLLTQNDVGGIAWVMASILSGNVPLILNAHTEPQLLFTLIDTYLPQFICAPAAMAEAGPDPVEAEEFGYRLRATGAPAPALDPELSHLLPTSGSTPVDGASAPLYYGAVYGVQPHEEGGDHTDHGCEDDGSCVLEVS